MRGDTQVRFGGRTRETHQSKDWQGALARPYHSFRWHQTESKCIAEKSNELCHVTPRIEQLEKEVAEILAEAKAIDKEEDALYGSDKRGDEVPAELA